VSTIDCFFLTACGEDEAIDAGLFFLAGRRIHFGGSVFPRGDADTRSAELDLSEMLVDGFDESGWFAGNMTFFSAISLTNVHGTHVEPLRFDFMYFIHVAGGQSTGSLYSR
jgi:hypothetical protein